MRRTNWIMPVPPGAAGDESSGSFLLDITDVRVYSAVVLWREDNNEWNSWQTEMEENFLKRGHAPAKPHAVRSERNLQPQFWIFHVERMDELQ